MEWGVYELGKGCPKEKTTDLSQGGAGGVNNQTDALSEEDKQRERREREPAVEVQGGGKKKILNIFE